MTRVSSRILGNILGLHAEFCENRLRAEGFVSLCLLCRDNPASQHHPHTSYFPGSPFSCENGLGF